MSTRLTDANVVQKLQAATNSQDSIQTLSLWLLHHRLHHEKIVINWLKVLRKAKVNQRLTLFYVANDVIQNSKRRNISSFKESFATVLKEATVFVRDDHIRPSVSRVFNIWGERNIYDADFVLELQEALDDTKSTISAAVNPIVDFKYDKLVERLRSVSKQEVDTNTKMATLNISKLNATNAEIVQKLKDRSHGQQFSNEFEESTRGLEELIKCLSKEIEDRKELMTLLEQGEIYYESQRGEARIVANAYKNFGSRVKSLQKKLPEVLARFPEPSPVPSPCADAPSPTTSELETELDLPEDHGLSDESLPPGKNVNNKDNSLHSTPNMLGGEPIPIVSTFFNQDQQMPSWLNAFSKTVSTPVSVESTKNSDSSSLDSRLSNLLQNIPNLPNSLQGSLLNSSVKTENTASTLVQKRVPTNSLSTSDSMTGKDEYSGQNTPVQDEDTLASSGASTFFSRLAATPKTPQTQKDILKGLTSMIQSASSRDSSHGHGNKAPATAWTSGPEEPLQKVSSFLNKITSKSSLSPSFHNSPVKTTSSNKLAVSIPDPVSATMHSQPAFVTTSTMAGDIPQNQSYIPTLVPSTPTGSSFQYKEENQFEEYDPDCQNFDMDMDVASEESNDAQNSPGHSESSSKTPEDDMPQPMNTTRQSALITLVTDSSLSIGSNPIRAEEIATIQKTYLPAVSVGHEYSDKKWPPADQDMRGDINNFATAEGNPQNTSAFVSLSQDMSLPPNIHSNGRGDTYSTEWPHSKIETVQSYRSEGEQKWADNDWSRFNADQQYPHFNRSSHEHNNRSYPGVKNQYPQHRYGSQNFWNERKPQHSGYDHGQQRPRFFSHASRGRGWKKYPHPY